MREKKVRQLLRKYEEQLAPVAGGDPKLLEAWGACRVPDPVFNRTEEGADRRRQEDLHWSLGFVQGILVAAGWMNVGQAIEDNKLTPFERYDKNYNQEQLCVCGHPYYRHFDWMGDPEYVSCKYCQCGDFRPDQEV